MGKYFVKMKFAVIALIATVSAIRLEDPNASYAAKAAGLAGSLQTVTTQQKFEADHFAMHSDNMATADSECSTLKTHVREARSAQVAGGNQYPPLKTYWSNWCNKIKNKPDYVMREKQLA